MMDYKALFFDLDGTLVDTHVANYGAYVDSIKSVVGNRYFDRNILYKQIISGANYRDFLLKSVKDISENEIKMVSFNKAKYYIKRVSSTKLNLKLISFAKEEKKKGLVIVLVTTARKVNAMEVLKFHGILDLFDITVFGDSIKYLKPAPDIYLKSLEISGFKSIEVKAYEDSINGIKAAKAAKIAVEQVIW